MASNRWQYSNEPYSFAAGAAIQIDGPADQDAARVLVMDHQAKLQNPSFHNGFGRRFEGDLMSPKPIIPYSSLSGYGDAPEAMPATPYAASISNSAPEVVPLSVPYPYTYSRHGSPYGSSHGGYESPGIEVDSRGVGVAGWGQPHATARLLGGHIAELSSHPEPKTSYIVPSRPKWWKQKRWIAAMAITPMIVGAIVAGAVFGSKS